MARQHFITPTAPTPASQTVRMGAGTTSGDNFGVDTEDFKFVKLGAESRYVLAAAGDKIEALVSSVEPATQGGYSIGGIAHAASLMGHKMYVIADGLQATPGTGAIAVGDYVVVGTVTAKGTALPDRFPKVCKATNQPGATVTSADNVVGNLNAAIAKVVDQLAVARFGWRVVSGTAGTGAVGTTLVIERV
jgi:hypothetical protein